MSRNILQSEAYAKINRGLRVTGVRADGYHTLDTVMQTVSLCDSLSAEPSEAFCFTCSDKGLESESNLCVKAVRRFAEATGFSPKVHIHLEKRIPYGAGLGGGSADAAAVLRMLCRLHPVSEELLYTLAVRLGADVPFCLHGGRCLCTGIGEVLSPLADGMTESLVIARGQVGLSTPEMYRALDAVAPWKKNADPVYTNDFEPVAAERLPDIAYLRRVLLQAGATEVSMSGSGSAVYGVFRDGASTDEVVGRLRNEGYFAASCRTVARY